MRITNVAARVERNLDRSGPDGKLAKAIGNQYDQARDKLFRVLSNSKASTAEIERAREAFDRSKRALELFDKLLERSHDMMMRIINRIGGH